MDKKDIYIINGNDPAAMVKALLDKIDIEALMPEKNGRVGLKPNLITSSTPDYGAVTHTEIVVALIEYLQARGYRKISVIESSWVGDSTERAFRLNGYPEIARRYGIDLVDVKRDGYVKKSGLGVTLEVSEAILDCTYLINLPVLKGHCQTLMTCAMKNLKGCISDRSKRLCHSLGLDRPIAAVNAILKPTLTIVDSINGDLDFEEGGTPVETNRMLAGRDSVLLDCYCATLMGYDPEEIGYLSEAMEEGLGNSDLSSANIVALNEGVVSQKRGTGRARQLERFTAPDSACSACYANLIHALARLQDEGMLPGEKIAIGQGYKGKTGGCGVGNCTRLFEHSVPGCPPTAKAIRESIEMWNI